MTLNFNSEIEGRMFFNLVHPIRRLLSRGKHTNPMQGPFLSTSGRPSPICQDTLHLVDPELRQWVLNAPAATYTPELVAVLRKQMAEQVRTADPEADGLPVRVTTHMVPGFEGGPEARVLLVTPVGDRKDRPGILYIHGGGFIVGSADLARLIRESGGSGVASVA